MSKLKEVYKSIDTIEFPSHDDFIELRTKLVIKIQNSINRYDPNYEERKKEITRKQKQKIWMRMYSELIEDLHKSLVDVHKIQVFDSKSQRKAADRLQKLLDKIQHPEKESKNDD